MLIENNMECVLSYEVFCKNRRYCCSNVQPRPNKNPQPNTTSSKYIVLNF